MQRYIARRLIQGVVVLLVLAVVIFVLGWTLGNPLDLMLPIDSTTADREHMARVLGLDQPYHVQFLRFLGNATHADFGLSIKFGRPARDIFLERLPNSLQLVGLAWGFAIVFGIPLGIISAVYKGKVADRVAALLAVTGMALPSFLLALVLIQVCAVWLGVLPAAGKSGISSYLLPALTLAFFQTAGMVRLLRSSMLDVLDSEFVKLARIKGVPERAVIWHHCLRNALGPVLSFAGVQIAVLITGAIVVETVFAWPGTGRLAYEAVASRDFPLLQTVVILAGALIILLNLCVDILYAYLDPRIRYSRGDSGN